MQAIKTDAPCALMWDILRIWVQSSCKLDTKKQYKFAHECLHTCITTYVRYSHMHIILNVPHRTCPHTKQNNKDKNTPTPTHTPTQGSYPSTKSMILSHHSFVSLCMYVCMICMYVCMHACMYVCMYVCMSDMYVCMYVYMYVCMYVCVYVCMYVCM